MSSPSSWGLDGEEEDLPSLQELVQTVLSAECWDRYLLVDTHGDVVTIRRKEWDHPDVDYSELDIVARYSIEAYSRGEVFRKDIRTECRAYLLKYDLLS